MESRHITYHQQPTRQLTYDQMMGKRNEKGGERCRDRNGKTMMLDRINVNNVCSDGALAVWKRNSITRSASLQQTYWKNLENDPQMKIEDIKSRINEALNKKYIF